MTYANFISQKLDKSDKKDDNLSSKLNLETAVIASNVSKGSLSDCGPIQVITNYILGPNG